MDNNLDALIAHYNDIQIRIENYNTKATNNVIVIITLVCAILGTNLLVIDKGYKTIFFIVIPMITLVGHYQFAIYTRYESVLQGYSVHLEKRINALIKSDVICWNSKYIDNFIVPKYFWTNKLSAPVFSLFVFLPNIYVFYSLFFSACINDEGVNVIFLIISLISFIVYIVVSTVLVHDCITNDKARKAAEHIEELEKSRKKKKHWG